MKCRINLDAEPCRTQEGGRLELGGNTRFAANKATAHGAQASTPSKQSSTLAPEAKGMTLSLSCAAGTIAVTAASYGKNCNGNLYNNQLSSLRSACDGKSACKYRVNGKTIGDPARPSRIPA